MHHKQFNFVWLKSLVGMTLLFFLLFYTFPASMVLYWTSTNSVQLISQEVGRLRRRRRLATAPPS